MGCACNQRGRTQFEVAMEGGRGRVAFTSGSKPTATTVAQRYAGSAVRIKGTGEIVHHTETYEVTATSKGAVLFASSDLDAAKAHAETLGTGFVRERETGEVVHSHPPVLAEAPKLSKKATAAHRGSAEVTSPRVTKCGLTREDAAGHSETACP
ncbi:hypothetical protein ABTY98_41535 [Streptomyces sp. NPDC096040]|uniref:hypothetical protein n=1 Tax=Streptomyces sp. NPDC096040 TaxID=3155541 RepID=UPI00331A3EFD